MRINALEYPTLQDALDDARDGDRIYLPAGTYFAPADGFRIRKQIELYGEGPGGAGGGTILKPASSDSTYPVLSVDPTGLGALENLYLHDFQIAGPSEGHGFLCGDPEGGQGTDKVARLRIERVLVTDFVGVGFAMGTGGDVNEPQLLECVTEKCGGGGAVFDQTSLGNVTHCRFTDGNTAMTGSALLQAMNSALAVYACVFEGSQAATSQLKFLDCTAPRVDACRFMSFPTDSDPLAEQKSALRVIRSPGGVVGGCYFELDNTVAGSKGIHVIPDLLRAGPVLILPNRFKNVAYLVYMAFEDSTDVKAAVVLPQFDDSASGQMVLPQDTNQGLVAVPAMNRSGSNALAGLALPSHGIPGQDPTYNETGGTLAYRFASNMGQVRAFVAGDWHTIRIGPAPVKDLRIRGRGRHSLAVGWSAPAGGATQYILKRSYAAINDNNFDSAADVPGMPTPGPPGSDECVVDAGLLECKRHYYALKSVDAQGRKSPISNVVTSTTFCSGTIEAQCL